MDFQHAVNSGHIVTFTQSDFHQTLHIAKLLYTGSWGSCLVMARMDSFISSDTVI